jgi:hypothetical protein
MTADPTEVAQLIAQVTDRPSLFEYSACVYSSGEVHVLVIDYFH